MRALYGPWAQGRGCAPCSVLCALCAVLRAPGGLSHLISRYPFEAGYCDPPSDADTEAQAGVVSRLGGRGYRAWGVGPRLEPCLLDAGFICITGTYPSSGETLPGSPCPCLCPPRVQGYPAAGSIRQPPPRLQSLGEVPLSHPSRSLPPA